MLTRHRTIAFTLGAVLACVSSSTAAPPPSRPAPAPSGAPQDPKPAPVASSWLDIQIPRPVPTEDGDYLAWISGATGSESGAVVMWVSLLAGQDKAWISELFVALNAQAAEYAERFGNSEDLDAMAAFLEPVVQARAQKVEELFARERELLRKVLAEASIPEDQLEQVAERVMAARRADAFEIDHTLARPLKANILHLLYVASSDPATTPEASAAVRRIAVDQAQRVCEQRRVVADAIATSTHRSLAAMARAEAEGGSSTGPMAGVFRPIAIAVARSAIMNREIAALARAELPADVGTRLVDTMERSTYGLLAEDFFATDRLAAIAMPLIPEPERETARQMLGEDRRARLEDRDRMLRVFDAQSRKFVEKGLVRESGSAEQFCNALLDYLDASRKRAIQTVDRLAELARSSPDWKQRTFDEERARWLAAAEARIQTMARSGVTSAVVPHTQMTLLLGGRLGRGSPGEPGSIEPHTSDR